MDVARVGYRAGLAAFAATIGYDVAQIAQVAGWLEPPVDEVVIYATSLCIVVPLVLELVALHHLTERSRQFWTHAALIFAAIYAVFVSANYIVQLATVVPARAQGRLAEVQMLVQTPHSLFWDYDAAGYIFLGLATLLLVPALDRERERGARLACLANAAVTPLIAIVYFAPTFSNGLLLLGFPWAVTAPLFMLMIARVLWARQPRA